MLGSTQTPVVVGVDGSAAADAAVGWAAREAMVRRRPLHVVYAADDDGPRGAELIEAALRRAARVAPGVAMSGGTDSGRPAAALVRLSREAVLVVVGAHAGRAPLGSTSLRTVTHAQSPVVVVPAGADDEPADRRIAVGTDGSALSDEAAGFAFEEADMRHLPLTAVHCWTGPTRSGPGDMLPLVYDVDEVAAEESRMLAESLAGWTMKYPDVPLAERTVHAPAGRTLARLADRVELLVVGAHGRGSVGGLLLGSTSRHVLYRASRPVAVVRPGR